MRAVYEEKEINVEGKIRVDNLLKRLNLNREEVLVIKGDALLNDDDWIGEDEVVEIWKVVSGG